MKKVLLRTGLLILACCLLPLGAGAQRRSRTQTSNTTYPETLYSSMQYRLIGPFRGGRSAAVTGVPGKQGRAYSKAAGGCEAQDSEEFPAEFPGYRPLHSQCHGSAK